MPKRLPFEVGPGTASVHVALLGADGSDVTSADSAASSALGAGAPAPLLVVSDDEGKLDSLERVVLPADMHVGTAGWSGYCPESGSCELPTESSCTTDMVRVAHAHPADLPSDAVALSSFAGVVLDGATTSELGTDQRSALLDYVHGGGALILVGGASVRSTLAGLPPELLPVRVMGQTAMPLPTLARALAARRCRVRWISPSLMRWMEPSCTPRGARRWRSMGCAGSGTFSSSCRAISA